jgi:hypothetical protein
MTTRTPITLVLVALLALAGCAKTKVSNRQEYTGNKIPRPGHILVYDFAATAADLPADSELAGRHSEHEKPQTAEQIEMGQKLGAEIAAHLVTEIRAMGMPAERAAAASQAQINDLIIRGYLLAVDKGDAIGRVAIGFGSGGSDLRAAAEGFQMTATGLRKLGGGQLDAGGGKTPGTALGVASLIVTHNPVGLIVGTGMNVYGEKSGKSTIEGRAEQTAKEIADQLRIKFKEQGWI